jgi:hypothetical protein
VTLAMMAMMMMVTVKGINQGMIGDDEPSDDHDNDDADAEDHGASRTSQREGFGAFQKRVT